MAKTKTSNKVDQTAAVSQEPQSVTIAYDLFDLPTAQHKAGLAGLLLQIDSMNNRTKQQNDLTKLPPSYEWDPQHPSTKVRVTFTQENVVSLFDDLYDADIVPTWFPQKKPKEHLLDQRIREAGTSKIKEYLYDTIRPSLRTLRQHSAGPSAEALVRLWQDMIWGVPRGVNTNRIPFEVVAGWDRKRPMDQRRVQKGHCPEAIRVWNAIRQVNCKKVALKGHLWLGAQETTAERLEFLSSEVQSLLLHFWHLATLVFVPQTFKVKQRSGRIEVKRAYDGFALAMPDILDLPDYCDRFRMTIADLATQPCPKYGRPQTHIVELPAQGAMSLIDHERQAALVKQIASGQGFRYSIAGVDYAHYRTSKNGPKLVGSGRLTVAPDLAERYADVIGSQFKNAYFRRGLLLALLNNVPWFRPFGKLFAELPAPLFVYSDKSPERWWFWADARKRLFQESQRMPNDPPPEEDVRLANAINGFIRQYLDERLKSENSDWDYRVFRKNKHTDPNAAEARRKLAERLFLEFRSRNHQAFASHFSGTFFRVPQFLGRDFGAIAADLMSRTDDVKTLTLMALSSNSWSPTPKKENAQ